MKDLPIVPGRETGKIHGSPAAPASVETRSAPPISFQALIERLRDQALTLEKTAAEPLNAQELSGAVHTAEASLQDALSIADGLVEAYRVSLLRRWSDLP